MGFNESLVPYLSRFIIAIELFIAVSILQNNYLKKIIIPGSILLLIIFSIHLAYQIFSGINDNKITEIRENGGSFKKGILNI